VGRSSVGYRGWHRDVLLGFETEPSTSQPPQTVHGWIHALAFLLVALAMVAAFLVLWRRLMRDPLWLGYGPYTLISGVLCVTLLFFSFADFPIPGQVAFYLFLAVMLVWIGSSRSGCVPSQWSHHQVEPRRRDERRRSTQRISATAQPTDRVGPAPDTRFRFLLALAWSCARRPLVRFAKSTRGVGARARRGNGLFRPVARQNPPRGRSPIGLGR
jgi:hypothetical protein